MAKSFLSNKFSKVETLNCLRIYYVVIQHSMYNTVWICPQEHKRSSSGKRPLLRRFRHPSSTLILKHVYEILSVSFIHSCTIRSRFIDLYILILFDSYVDILFLISSIVMCTSPLSLFSKSLKYREVWQMLLTHYDAYGMSQRIITYSPSVPPHFREKLALFI